MNMEILREFFMWMTVINLLLLIWIAVMCMLLKNVIVRVHGKLFGLSPEAIRATLYGFLGAYKVLFIVVVFIPWLALLIMT